MDWLYYFLPVAVIIIFGLLQRKIRMKRNIQTVEISNKNDCSELENENDTKLTSSMNEDDPNSTSTSGYMESVSTSLSSICRNESSKNEIQDTKLTSSMNEDDLNSTSTSEYMESVSTSLSSICRNECPENEIHGMNLTSSWNEEADNTSTSEFMDSLSTLPSSIIDRDYSANSNLIFDMKLTPSKDEKVHFNNTSTAQPESAGKSSSILPSYYDSKDYSENDVQYVEDFSDAGLYLMESDENDIGDNMNNAFIEIEL